jgi:acyl-CoA thioesterase I
MPRLLIPIYLLVAFAGQLSAQIVAFGASNVAGAGVEPQQAWPAQLEKLLKAQGQNIHIINAGINGDTTADMLKRVDSAIPNGAKIVMLDTGGGFYNDSKNDISREQGEKNFAAIKARIQARGIKIVREFSYRMSPKWKQPDQIHLTADGHKELARLHLPFVIKALTQPTAPPTAPG